MSALVFTTLFGVALVFAFLMLRQELR